jgi:hypothetical protein
MRKFFLALYDFLPVGRLFFVTLTFTSFKKGTGDASVNPSLTPHKNGGISVARPSQSLGFRHNESLYEIRNTELAAAKQNGSAALSTSSPIIIIMTLPRHRGSPATWRNLSINF